MNDKTSQASVNWLSQKEIDDLQKSKENIMPFTISETDLLARWFRGESLANKHLRKLYVSLLDAENEMRGKDKDSEGNMSVEHRILFVGLCSVIHSVSSVMWARGMDLPVRHKTKEAGDDKSK